jgi:UV DNA damage endonuclease
MSKQQPPSDRHICFHFVGSKGIPFVYDVHHHRCTPKGWIGPKPNRHHDYISIRDFPEFWPGLDVTVEVEAKAKELAVRRLARE